MKTFEVSLLHFDEPAQSDSDRLNIPLTRLFSGVAEATDEKYAAARAWIDNVGTHRWERLDDMKAPDVIRSSQVDAKAIAEQLISTSIWADGIAFLLDNQVEAWLISVHEIEPESQE